MTTHDFDNTPDDRDLVARVTAGLHGMADELELPTTSTDDAVAAGRTRRRRRHLAATTGTSLAVIAAISLVLNLRPAPPVQPAEPGQPRVSESPSATATRTPELVSPAGEVNLDDVPTLQAGERSQRIRLATSLVLAIGENSRAAMADDFMVDPDEAAAAANATWQCIVDAGTDTDGITFTDGKPGTAQATWPDLQTDGSTDETSIVDCLDQHGLLTELPAAISQPSVDQDTILQCPNGDAACQQQRQELRHRVTYRNWLELVDHVAANPVDPLALGVVDIGQLGDTLWRRSAEVPLDGLEATALAPDGIELWWENESRGHHTLDELADPTAWDLAAPTNSGLQDVSILNLRPPSVTALRTAPSFRCVANPPDMPAELRGLDQVTLEPAPELAAHSVEEEANCDGWSAVTLWVDEGQVVALQLWPSPDATAGVESAPSEQATSATEANEQAEN